MNNFIYLHSQIDEKEFLNELPPNIRDELLYTQYGAVVETIHLLRESDDTDFIWELIQQA